MLFIHCYNFKKYRYYPLSWEFQKKCTANIEVRDEYT